MQKTVGFMVTLWAALCCPVLLIFRHSWLTIKTSPTTYGILIEGADSVAIFCESYSG